MPSLHLSHLDRRIGISLSNTASEPIIDLVLEKCDSARGDAHRLRKTTDRDLAPHCGDRERNLFKNS